jgi:precorrin-6B C5,15-methyltransferase / cobalt-precorrin-6B C5,C15-methyltransferase
MNKWLSIVGIGEEGLAGLTPIARSLVDRATVIVGGDRHLAMLPPSECREILPWASPISATIAEIIRRRGQLVCVLASGDPLCYGVGVTLLRQISIAEITIVPAPSAFSLACARLGWSFTEVETLSLCGRDPALIQAVLYPGARILVLSETGRTPIGIAQLLTERGFGDSRMTVLERMGGTQERKIEGIAANWTDAELADLNTIAIDCIAASNSMADSMANSMANSMAGSMAGSAAGSTAQIRSFSRLAGLPDTAYQHDGQLTKREIRAVTLSALAPLPGQLLWDVGAGCGSISVEWMRSDRRCRAIAIEQHSDRLGLIADNAAALGTPTLNIVAGKAPDALVNLPQPDAIFIGGGLTADSLLETCWQALRSGGRLVANAVTVEGEQKIFQAHHQLGGTLTRIAIQRTEPIGKFCGWKAMAPITQWGVTK